MKTPDIIRMAARDLRNNMTKSEVIFWKFIQSKLQGHKFLRQKPIYVYTENTGLPRFIIADFYCHARKLIIEIDGSIHNNLEVAELDTVKENLLQNLGYSIFRIKNEEIFEDIEKVLEKIVQKLK